MKYIIVKRMNEIEDGFAKPEVVFQRVYEKKNLKSTFTFTIYSHHVHHYVIDFCIIKKSGQESEHTMSKT